jgi:CubicO group peptidase (beta-lactamase class C family)
MFIGRAAAGGISMASLLSELTWLDETIRAEMERWQVPGVSVGILKDGEVEIAGYGVVNLETGYPVLPETLFQIGSISMTFTATLVLQLVDEGLLDLDVPLIVYVPDLPLADETARTTITLRHVLTHTAGFYGDRFDDQGNGDNALAKAVAAFGTLAQQTAPGELWTYCNAGFDLASRAVELALGQSFESALRERIFKPLGFDRATYFASEAILHSVSAGHVPGEDGEGNFVADPWPIPRRSNGAGGISANPAILLRWAQLHIEGGSLNGVQILKPETVAMMQAHQAEGAAGASQGLAWFRRAIDGVEIVGHDGGTNGQQTKLIVVPSKNFAIAILTNSTRGASAHAAIGAAALERMLGLKDIEPVTIELSEADLAPLAGVYRQELAEITLTVTGSGFDVASTNINAFSGVHTRGDAFRLLPLSRDLFVAEGGGVDGAKADFIFNPDGSVRFLRFRSRLAFRT